jgi:hypothetical protein
MRSRKRCKHELHRTRAVSSGSVDQSLGCHVSSSCRYNRSSTAFPRAPIELINRSRRGPYSKMNKSASRRSNEDKLRGAAQINDLGVIRDLLARRINPNSRNEVSHSFRFICLACRPKIFLFQIRLCFFNSLEWKHLYLFKNKSSRY